jgi:hypothetical protein
MENTNLLILRCSIATRSSLEGRICVDPAHRSLDERRLALRGSRFALAPQDEEVRALRLG